MQHLASSVVARIGGFLDHEDCRSCISAHRCFGSVMETSRTAAWTLRPAADYGAKARALARRKPLVRQLHLVMHDGGWHQSCGERQAQALADALGGALSAVRTVTLTFDTPGPGPGTNAALLALLRGLVSALPPSIHLTGHYVKADSVSMAVDVADALLAVGEHRSSLTWLVIDAQSWDGVTAALAERYEVLAASAPRRVGRIFCTDKDVIVAPESASSASRVIRAMRALSVELTAYHDSALEGIADDVRQHPECTFPFNAQYDSLMQCLASNDALRTWALHSADLASMAIDGMDLWARVLRTRGGVPTTLYLSGCCATDPNLPNILTSLLLEAAECRVVLHGCGLVAAVIARRVLDQLRPDLARRVDARFDEHLQLKSCAELEQMLLVDAGVDARARRRCILMGIAIPDPAL